MRVILQIILVTAVFSGSPAQGPRNPVKEMQKKAEKEAAEKNYKELRDAAMELADLSRQISSEIDAGGEHVISARIFERLEKIEKLTKRIREKAKGNSASIPKIE